MSEAKEKLASVEQKPVLDIEDIQKAFEERQKALVGFLDKETNIANRYEIKVRLDELNVVYNAVMRLVK